MGHPLQRVCRTKVPTGKGLGQIVHRSKRPLVLAYLVQTLVVKHGHQRGISRCAVRIHHLQPPLLLLSGNQPVTERLPCQSQFLVWHRTLDTLLMDVTLVVLHPCIGHEQTVAVFFTIGEFPVEQFSVLFHHTTFNHLVACKNAIDDMKVRIDRSHLQCDGCTVVGELIVRHIEPVMGLKSRLHVVQAENNELHVNLVVTTNSFQTMLARL